MNWKGYLVLGLLLAGVAGVFGYKFVSESIAENTLRSYESRIEEAVHGKIDNLDIEINTLAGLEGDILWIYLYSEGQTAAPLTEREFEAVDAVFMDLIEYSESKFVVWAWARPTGGLDGQWYIVVATTCESDTVLFARDNPNTPAKCQTAQTFQPLEAKHLRWLND